MWESGKVTRQSPEWVPTGSDGVVLGDDLLGAGRQLAGETPVPLEGQQYPLMAQRGRTVACQAADLLMQVIANRKSQLRIVEPQQAAVPRMDATQPSQIRGSGRHRAGSRGREQSFQRLPRRGEVPHLPHRHRRHLEAASGLAHQQVQQLQPAYRVAQGGAADVEVGGQALLGLDLARGDLTVRDSMQ